MTEPTLTAAESAHTQPRSQLCADLELPESTGDTELISELVRALAHASTAGTTPVQDELLIDRVVAHLMPAFLGTPASKLRESAQATVLALAALGDLVLTSDGSWVSGATFSVDRSPAPRDLLISGLPLRLFDPTIRARIVLDGCRRHHTGPIDKPVLTIEQWAGDDIGPLDQWTDAVLTSDGLNPVPPRLFDTAIFTFYRPGYVSATATAGQRWTPTDQSLTGRVLMRIQQPPEVTRFAIAQMKSGRLVSFRHIHHDDAQRLTFGLDLRHHRAATLNEVTKGRSVTLSIDRPVPNREARLLAHLATSFAPDRWTVSTGATQAAVEILGAIGMHSSTRRPLRDGS